MRPVLWSDSDPENVVGAAKAITGDAVYAAPTPDPCLWHIVAVQQTDVVLQSWGATQAHFRCAFCARDSGVLNHDRRYGLDYGRALLVVANPDHLDDDAVVVVPVCGGHWATAVARPRFVAAYAWARTRGSDRAVATVTAAMAEHLALHGIDPTQLYQRGTEGA